jgi:aldehyde:ferredoxin oxidoreductase
MNDSSENQVFGYVGNLLRVDLTTGSIKVEPLDPDLCRRYMGGSGLISYYLWKELAAGIDAMGPENKLVIATGPLTGTPLMGSGRHSIGAKSPLTGGIALSQVGEFWGTELKRAGFDVVIIEGASDKPVWLNINNGKVEIRDAGHLWGLETREAQAAIREELGDEKVRVSLIGPGAENLVKYGCIMCGLYDAAGRGGMGAVMGSKKLKAIAVRGTGRISVVGPEKLREINKRLVAANDQVQFSRLAGGPAPASSLRRCLNGDVPIRNWRDGRIPL